MVNLHETPSTGHIKEAPGAAPETALVGFTLGWVVDQVLGFVDHLCTLSVQRSQSDMGHYPRPIQEGLTDTRAAAAHPYLSTAAAAEEVFLKLAMPKLTLSHFAFSSSVRSGSMAVELSEKNRYSLACIRQKSSTVAKKHGQAGEVDRLIPRIRGVLIPSLSCATSDEGCARSWSARGCQTPAVQLRPQGAWFRPPAASHQAKPVLPPTHPRVNWVVRGRLPVWAWFL